MTEHKTADERAREIVQRWHWIGGATQEQVVIPAITAEITAAEREAIAPLRLAATRLEILTARMRACHAETGKHELLEEAEMFCEEARAACRALVKEGE